MYLREVRVATETVCGRLQLRSASIGCTWLPRVQILVGQWWCLTKNYRYQKLTENSVIISE